MTYKTVLTLLTLVPVIAQPRSASPTPANSPALLLLPAIAMPELLNLLLLPSGRSMIAMPARPIRSLAQEKREKSEKFEKYSKENLAQNPEGAAIYKKQRHK